MILFTAALYGLIVGLSLGVTGGGGTILAVPLLIYGLGYQFREAVAASLFIVGATSLFGALTQLRSGRILWGAAVILGVGGLASAPLGSYAGSLMPTRLSMILFAVLMILVAVRTLGAGRDGWIDIPLDWAACKISPEKDLPDFTFACSGKLLIAGIVTGLLSGMFGVGGGFVIVPALIAVTSIDLNRALSTSLLAIFIVACSALASNYQHLNASLLPSGSVFFAGALTGMIVGLKVRNKIPETVTRRIFVTALFTAAAVTIYKTLAG